MTKYDLGRNSWERVGNRRKMRICCDRANVAQPNTQKVYSQLQGKRPQPQNRPPGAHKQVELAFSPMKDLKSSWYKITRSLPVSNSNASYRIAFGRVSLSFFLFQCKGVWLNLYTRVAAGLPTAVRACVLLRQSPRQKTTYQLPCVFNHGAQFGCCSPHSSSSRYSL